MRSQVYRIIPVVLLGALALTGCSGGDDPGDGKPAGAKEAWLQGNANDLQLDQAVAQLARKCMEGKGFSVHPADPTTGEQQVTNPDELIADPGPALDPAQAAANGYGFDPRGSESAEPEPGGSTPPGGGEPGEPGADPSGDPATPPGGGEGEGPADDGERFYTELTEAQQSEYWVALDGVDKNKFLNEYYEKNAGGDGEEPQLPTYEQVALADGTKRQYPTQGCQAEVNARVFTDGMASYLEKEHLAEESFATVISVDLEQGADMKALADKWSQCMAGKGFEGLSTPNDAYETASAYYWGGRGTENGESPAMPTGAALDEAKAKEVELAVAHAACDQETGYTTGRAALMKGALDAFVTAHDADLRAWDAYVTKALGTAQSLLGK